MTLTIQGSDLFWDGQILNSGRLAEGLMLNSRMVQATSDFSGQMSQWDEQANTDAFVAMLPIYRSNGVDGITVNFQGGLYARSWLEAYNNSAWNSDGTLKVAYRDRMQQAIEGMISHNIIPIVGIFYFRQDQILQNETAVIAAVDNAMAFLDPWKDSILIEVINESSHGLVDHAILQPTRCGELISRCQTNGFFASASMAPGGNPPTSWNPDIVLLHGNNRTPSEITTMVNNARNRFPNRPIAFNEDGPTDTDFNDYTPQEYIDNLNAAVNAGAGWGYYTQNGFQSNGIPATTIDWSLDGPTAGLATEKQTVFGRFSEIGSGEPGGGGGDGYWLEANRRVVFEVESITPVPDWVLESSDPGHSGTGYFTQAGAASMTQPGNGILRWQFRITNADDYFIAIHTRRQGSGASDANNDCWMRIDGGAWEKFFQRIGDPATDGGSGSHEVWRWAGRIERGGVNIDPVFPLSAGNHSIEISKRSDQFSIDKIHIFARADAQTPTMADNPPLSTAVSEFEGEGSGGGTLVPTRMIGMSVSSSLFDEFEADARVNDADWELLFNGGGSVSNWSDPNYVGWSNALVSPIASFEKVLMHCAQGTSNLSTLIAALEDLVTTIRGKYGASMGIVLMPQFGGYQGGGGHGDPVCQVGGTNVRDAQHHEAMLSAIETVVSQGTNLEVGPDIHIGDCAFYDDSIGHLTQAGQDDAADKLAAWVATLGAPAQFTENTDSGTTVFTTSVTEEFTGTPIGGLPENLSVGSPGHAVHTNVLSPFFNVFDAVLPVDGDLWVRDSITGLWSPSVSHGGVSGKVLKTLGANGFELADDLQGVGGDPDPIVAHGVKYVSQVAGDDVNSGNDPTDPLATITAAFSALSGQSGKIVVFDGDYTAALSITQAGVAFEAIGDVWWRVNGGAFAITCDNLFADLTVDGFKFIALDPSSQTCGGYYGNGTKRFHITNCEFHNFGRDVASQLTADTRPFGIKWHGQVDGVWADWVHMDRLKFFDCHASIINAGGGANGMITQVQGYGVRSGIISRQQFKGTSRSPEASFRIGPAYFEGGVAGDYLVRLENDTGIGRDGACRFLNVHTKALVAGAHHFYVESESNAFFNITCEGGGGESFRFEGSQAIGSDITNLVDTGLTRVGMASQTLRA